MRIRLTNSFKNGSRCPSLRHNRNISFDLPTHQEHELDVSGEARRPTLAHVKALADRHGISRTKLQTILDATRTGVAQWPTLAKSAGVSTAMRDQTTSTLRRIASDFAPG
jgi:hypothetical protein